MSLIKKLNCWIITLGNIIQPFFLLAIRILWGLAFFFAGVGKVLSVEKTAEFFNSISLPYPHFQAYLVGFTEAICGILLAVGFASRLVSIPLIVVMGVALATVHREGLLNIYSDFQNFSSQAPIPFLLTALTVLCFGPGLFSIDALLGKCWCTNDKCDNKK